MDEQVRDPEPQSYEVYADGLGMFAAIGIVFMVLGLWMLTGIRPWQGPSTGPNSPSAGGSRCSSWAPARSWSWPACTGRCARSSARTRRGYTSPPVSTRPGRRSGRSRSAPWRSGSTATRATAGGYEHHRAVWVTLHSGRRHEYVARRQGGGLSADELRTGLSRFAGEVPVRWTDEVERRF